MADNNESALCPICGRVNGIDKVFCGGCVAPLQISRLVDLNQDDLQMSLGHVLHVVLDEQNRNPDSSSSTDQDELLTAYLNAFWLRPESALLQYAEARIEQDILKSYVSPPFLDIGCGDGVGSSLLMGWRFAAEFDVYHDLDLEAVDIYDSVPQNEAPVTITTQGKPIDYGVDIKQSMVERARLLGTFGRVMQANAARIPLRDGEIGCVYSNVIPDVDDEMVDLVLSECSRVLRSGGHLIMRSPTETYRDHLFYYPRAVKLRDQGEYGLADTYFRLDQGRSNFCSQQIKLSEWEKKLAGAGFTVVQATPYASRRMLEFWDTGLRPFSPVLISWVNQMKGTGNLPSIKKLVVSAMQGILHSLVDDLVVDDGGFRVIIARKS